MKKLFILNDYCLCVFSLTHFQDALADFTKIPSSHQLLFHETWSVESLVVAGNDKPVPIQVTSAEHPLFVVPVNQASAKPAMENYDLRKACIL